MSCALVLVDAHGRIWVPDLSVTQGFAWDDDPDPENLTIEK